MTGVGIVVTGATGRMGRSVLSLLGGREGFRLLGACDRPDSDGVGSDAGIIAGGDENGVLVTGDLARSLDEATRYLKGEESDHRPMAVIDFTSAEASARHAEISAERRVPLVIGSTGFDEGLLERVREAASKVPIVLAPNMSVGINLMVALAKRAAEVLGQSYDVELLEAHHRNKVDAPSGTALRLASVLAETRGARLEDVGVYERRGMTGARTAEEIGLQTIRGGDVVGEHTIFFLGDGDRIELVHRATSRDIFVKGAFRAVHWLMDKPAGLYGMEDVLGI